MKSIVLCFANDEQESLTTLREERTTLSRLFDQGASRNHFMLKEIPNATIAGAFNGMTSYADSLAMFLFSGHANQNALMFEDGQANAVGLAEILNECPELKLVVLNGCSTVGQVKALLNLPSKPAVIATSSPVEDKAATLFSITLFDLMINKNMALERAFNLSVANLKLNSSILIGSTRELVSMSEDDGVWGVFIPEENQKLKNWRIPNKVIEKSKKAKKKKPRPKREININNMRDYIESKGK